MGVLSQPLLIKHITSSPIILPSTYSIPLIPVTLFKAVYAHYTLTLVLCIHTYTIMPLKGQYTVTNGTRKQ